MKKERSLENYLSRLLRSKSHLTGVKEKSAMQNAKLEDTWKLVSCEARSSNGEVAYPYGIKPFGMLMYDRKGNMSALLMRPDRPKFACARATLSSSDFK